MIKRYYQSLNSLAYAPFLTGASLIVFGAAFIYAKQKTMPARLVLAGAFTVLAVIMIFYYRRKVLISLTLKKINDLDAYEEGGMVKHTYVLADKMLVYYRGRIAEYRTAGIKSVAYAGRKNGRGLFTLSGEEGAFCLESDSSDQARAFAAFIRKQNPGVLFTGIAPAGEGSLKRLGGK